jgi:cysteine desulfurase/selenocysteine lyase
VYLDSAATAQKPRQVINALRDYYTLANANPHSGSYILSAEASLIYEAGREKVAEFIGAESAEEIIFTAGATEGLKLVALGIEDHISKDDEVLVTIMEHHSNLLPWQRLSQRTGAKLRFVYCEQNGEILDSEWDEKISCRTKLIALNHMSNVLGSMPNISKVVSLARKYGAKVLLDAAQSVAHIKIDVQELGVDFLVFSGHKMMASTGIGALYVRKGLLDELSPLMLGGGIVEEVGESETQYVEGVRKFEAGTPNLDGVIELSAAIDYLQDIGWENVAEIQKDLVIQVLEKMKNIPSIEIYGTREASIQSGIISFNVHNIHPHDVASILDSRGVAIRAGRHCAQPLMQYLGLKYTCRASFYIYNTEKDVDAFIEALAKVSEVMKYEN